MHQNKFKTDKVTRILFLYQQLMLGKHIEKDLFVLEHGINDRTFDRDIEDLRLFLADSFSYRELIYDKQSKSYFLTEGGGFASLEQSDARLLLKLLFSSKALRKDEVEGLSQCVLSVVNKTEKEGLEKIIKEELGLYKSEEMGAILKSINDLYYVIDRKLCIDIRVKIDSDIVTILNAIPIDVVLKENEFILKYELNREEKMMSINKIVSFKIRGGLVW